MIDYEAIINNFYPEANKRLRDILWIHSRNVADMALRIYDAHTEMFETEGGVGQRALVEAAAMLHDIGIVKCDAPGIECHGTEPYICHGTLGARMIRELDIASGAYGLDERTQEIIARVCERHTGTGLSAKQIITQDLPLPHKDFVPETPIEVLVCYADKFFSKTHPERTKTFERAEHSLMKFGEEGLMKFRRWHDMFGV